MASPAGPALVALACVALAGAGVATPRAGAAGPAQEIVVADTLEAALGQPLVHVQLADGRRVLTARPTDLQRLMGDERAIVRSFTAHLDTGSSGCVISRTTASRFGVEAAPEAVFHEIGLHGALQMGVSRPYTMALADFGGDLTEQPSEFESVVKNAVFQMSLADPAPGLALAGGGIDVVGMPAIRRLVIEIDPTAMSQRLGGLDRPGEDLLERLEDLAAQPVVRLHSPRKRPMSIDVEIQLEYVDYNRRAHPGNRGPLPALASNPMITDVVTEHGARTFTGDWLLDTGAATSIISTGHARALGLYDGAGNPARAPEFTVMLGGIGGDVRRADGFVLDRLRIRGARSRALEFRRVHVVVRDVGIEVPGEDRFVLQGVLGMNLLLPSASGLGEGNLTGVARAPFKRIWIDGPRHTLSLDLP